MLSNQPHMRVLKYIFVASVLLLLMATDCDYSLKTPSEPPGGGIVRRAPDSSSITHESAVVLTAVPKKEGLSFLIGSPPEANPR